MPKSRSHVPAALHSELTEYASLLRALRTTKTLDLAEHLIRHPRRDQGSPSDDEEEIVSTHRATSPPLTSEPDTRLDSEPLDPQDEVEEKRKLGDSASTTTKDSELLTRWPLLAGDVHAPEFGLDEEIKLIASRVLYGKKRPHSAVDVSEDEEFDEDYMLPPSALAGLAFGSSHHLSALLSAISLYSTPVARSSVNRLKPMDWQAVLSVSNSSGLVNPQ